MGQILYRGLPFCNFVRNRIYVLEVEMLEPVLLARYLQKGRGIIFEINYYRITISCEHRYCKISHILSVSILFRCFDKFEQ